MSLVLMLLIVIVALLFDFMNGFHDAANSIATVVSTRVLSPRMGVIWAAVFNFAAAFGFGVGVASTIGRGIIATNIITDWLILSALTGAIAWDVITWWLGLPTSSSHALVGGLIGAGIVAGGWNVVQTGEVGMIALFIVLSPIVGLIAALGLIFVSSRLARRFPVRWPTEPFAVYN